MRFVTLIIAATALTASPAMANTTVFGGGIIGGFEAGQSGGFEVKGVANGSSASGSQVEFKSLNNPTVVAFGSIGAAGSSVEVTPFSVNTDSHHSGAFAGFNNGGAKFEGQVQNFGQAQGEGKFEAFGDGFQHIEVGFAAFGGFAN